MSEAEILKIIEQRIKVRLKGEGWAEEDAGFAVVLQWIEQLRLASNPA